MVGILLRWIARKKKPLIEQWIVFKGEGNRRTVLSFIPNRQGQPHPEMGKAV